MKTDEKLLHLYKEVKRKEKLQIHLRHFQEDILKNHAEYDALTLQMKDEEEDVRRLEEMSLESIFRTILGNKAQQLEKERQEYLHVLMKMQHVAQNLKVLEQEKAVLERSFDSLFNVGNEFDKLLKEKEEVLKNDPEYSEEVDHINEKIAVHEIKIEEIEEAINFGEKALKQLHELVINLNDMEYWNSDPDIKFTRKISKKRKLRQDIYTVNRALQSYERELKDLADHLNLDYQAEMRVLQEFLEGFVDRLITDWVMQHRINHSKNFLSNVIDRVRLLNNMLAYEIEKTRAAIDAEEELKADALVRFLKNQKWKACPASGATFN